jgi:RNA polymerase sigma-70 factor (ECF subfamily)
MRLLTATAVTPADAEDALQEAFIAAWRSAADFTGTDSARGWILTIARNALHRRYRRRVGEPETFEPLDGLGAAAGWGAEEPPDVLLERLEDRERLRRALDALPAPDREVLILRDLEELSGEETARMLGLSLQAMKSRLHRARLRLAARVREDIDA